MGFRFQRKLRLFPGVRLNFSKSGASISLGGPGLTTNIGKDGAKATVGIPGTGMSYSTYRPHTNAPKAGEGSIAPERKAYRMWMWVALVAIGFFVLSRWDYIKSGLM